MKIEKEMMEAENVSFADFYNYLVDKDIGNWDNVNSEEIIKSYCTDMMAKGIHISHIIEAIEQNPSDEGFYEIWLGNSMETPTPINNKRQLYDALGLEDE